MEMTALDVTLLHYGSRHGGPGQLSRYSYSLWPGRFGNRIPMWGDFYRLSRMTLKLAQPPIQWVPGYCLGIKRSGRDVDHPPHLAPKLKSRAIPLLPIWAFVVCSRVNLTFSFLIRHLCRIAKSDCQIRHVCFLSVLPSDKTTRLQLAGFSLNLILADFSKFCGENSSFMKI